MELSSPPVVCRACGRSFPAHGQGLGALCFGCLLAPGVPDEAEAAPPAEETPPADDDRRFAHYEILPAADGSRAELGRGAMGITYRARDTTLRCAVALKVVAPEIAGDRRARARFLREAQAAAGLRHPHVASVFFYGERPGDHQPFYAMELVEGETLEARVRRSGGLPVATVLEIGAQLAGALAAAEARGLTHRDLKPANVMLVRGGGVHVKIIDFGLAKLAADTPAGAAGLTRVDEFVGTPAFASPEHFNAWQETDARSDFYALGATLWFALTGHAPFTGRTLAEIRERQLHQPLPLALLRAARVPRAVADLLRALLSPDPAGRPQTADELAAALAGCRVPRKRFSLGARWGVAALAVAALDALFIVAGPPERHPAGRPVPPGAPVPEKSVAVLPFANLSEDRDSGVFANGVQEEVLTDLARIADLKVISRTSVMAYQNPGPRNLREVAAALGVSHVVEGSVQRAGNQIRVTAQLIDARTDAHQWAEHYDRDLADIFSIQSDIAQAIADQLRVRLSSQERAAIQERPTADLAAYDLYLQGKELIDRSTYENNGRKVLPEAVRLLDEAVRRDGRFFAAWCLLARANEEIYWSDFDPSARRAGLVLSAIEQAARLRPDAGEVHLARAMYVYHHFRDYEGATRELELARRALPNDADVFLWRGSIARRQGRWRESVQEYKDGMALNPRGLYLINELWIDYQFLRRHDEEARLLDYLLTINPDDAAVHAAREEVPLASHADSQTTLAAVSRRLDEGPAAAENTAAVAIDFALCRRDATLGARALAADPELADEPLLGLGFPHGYLVGLVARLRHDEAGARAAFQAARVEMEGKLAAAPDDANFQAILGVVDAALGHHDDAIREGEGAVRAIPLGKDTFLGAKLLMRLAIVHANVGEKERALELLAALIDLPGGPNYGYLRLHPHWDPLRGDPRFEALVARLAPVEP